MPVTSNKARISTMSFGDNLDLKPWRIMTKSIRKKHHKLLRDARTGTPLTQNEWIAETKRIEETDYRKTALKEGLLSWMKKHLNLKT